MHFQGKQCWKLHFNVVVQALCYFNWKQFKDNFIIKISITHVHLPKLISKIFSLFKSTTYNIQHNFFFGPFYAHFNALLMQCHFCFDLCNTTYLCDYFTFILFIYLYLFINNAEKWAWH